VQLYLTSGILMTAGSALMFTVTMTPLPLTSTATAFFLAAGSELTCNAGYTIAGIK
jgi:hypothetical protein